MVLFNRGIVRNRLLATVAFSALMGGTALAQPAPVAFTWVGPYAGLNLGYIGGWSKAHETDDVLGPDAYAFGSASAHGSSILGGGQVGYNWQFGWTVIGVEGDFQGTGLSSSGNNGVTGDGIPAPMSLHTSLSELGTIRGRAGYAFATMPLLVYGTAGIAYGNLKDTVTGMLDNQSGSASSNGWRAGWAAGGGVEYAFAPQWTVRAEGLYVDFGSVDVQHTQFGETYRFNIRDTAVIGRAAINFKF